MGRKPKDVKVKAWRVTVTAEIVVDAWQAHGAGLLLTEEAVVAAIKDASFKAKSGPFENQVWAEVLDVKSVGRTTTQYPRSMFEEGFADGMKKEDVEPILATGERF